MKLSNCIKYSGFSSFSKNGNLLSIAKGNNLIIYEVNSLKKLNKYNFTSQITQIEFSPDSNFILVGLYKLNEIEIKNLQNNKTIIKISQPIFGISNSIFSPDSTKLLLFSNYNIRLDIYDLTKEKNNSYISYPKYNNKAYSFSPNNFFFAIAERKNVKDYINIFYSGDYTLLSRFPSNTSDLSNLIWTKDNSSIIVIENEIECKLLIYSVTGNLLMINEAYNNNLGIFLINISPNGHFITVAYGDNNIRLFHYITYKKICCLNHNLDDINLKNENDNVKVNIIKEVNGKFERYFEKNINGYLLKGNNKKNNINNKNEKNICLMEYNFDSIYLASKSSLYENIVFIWNIPSLTLNCIIILNSNVIDFKWSPFENKLIIATNNLSIYIYTINKMYILNLPTDNFNFSKMTWNEDGKSILIQDKNKMFIAYSDIEELNE